MPNYQVNFVGGGLQNRPSMDVVCVSDQQALNWASGKLAHHLVPSVVDTAADI